MKKQKLKSKVKPHDLPPRLDGELAASSVVKPLDPYVTNVYHAVNPGDLIAAMGAIKKYWEVTKRKVKVLQSVQQKAAYYAGATHPTVNEQGENVCCNIPMFNMLKPLIESQPYIHSMEVYAGQKIDLDFNTIRGKTNVNMPHGPIQGWIALAFPDLSFDMTKPWMSVEDECPKHISSQAAKKVIINFTERYRNQNIDYSFLKNYAPDLIFAGTEKEHFLFCNQWGLTIPLLKINDFLEYAHAIKMSRFILGNQSLCWNLAEATKHPRLLEMCPFADNCFPMVGEYSYGYFYQVGAEYNFRKLYNETQNN